ncbi:MAG TPA: hypothetical protein VE954_29285, partial [Oligoflexus sp.]|uniref:hypothetical protein n=1 Tax=Oligoflexus sp. TaxID=1971216 RepID=UPI002D4342B4
NAWLWRCRKCRLAIEIEPDSVREIKLNGFASSNQSLERNLLPAHDFCCYEMFLLRSRFVRAFNEIGRNPFGKSR